MKQKLISIVINCYNGEKYLKKTLESILNQNYQNFEVIFIDNCSSDKSSKIFKKIDDKRFKYFKTKSKIKLYDARNLALRKCKGNFITFLDTDDWWNKNFLSSRSKFYNSSKKYGFCFSNCLHYFENKKKFVPFSKNKLPSGFILEKLLKNYFVKMSTIIIKKELISSFRFNSSYNVIGDFDFIIRVARKYKGMGFQDFLVNIRIHRDNFTHNNRRMFYQEFSKWIKEQNFKEIFFKRSQLILLQKLEYLRIIYLLLNNKKFKLIFDIIKVSPFSKKLKLLLIYFLPIFLINLKLKYF
tara:strand:- start:1347 stop:2240 length:894 start_codon:yes stop_codon:yes gene_type:complete